MSGKDADGLGTLNAEETKAMTEDLRKQAAEKRQ